MILVNRDVSILFVESGDNQKYVANQARRKKALTWL